MGLAASEHIGQILIDPRNSNVVYVAAQGPLWSAGGERGLYKTTDGGTTWDGVLTISDGHRHQRHRLRPEESRRHLRLVVSAAARGRPDDRRRTGGRDLQVDQRRQEVDEADEGPAERRRRPRGARRRSEEPGARLRADQRQGAARARRRRRRSGAPARRPTRRPRRLPSSTKRASIAPTTRARPGRASARRSAAARRGGAARTAARPRPAAAAATGIAAAAPRTTRRSSSTRTVPTRSGRSTPISTGARTAARPGSRPVSRTRPGCTSITTSSRFDPTDPNHILIGNDGGVYESLRPRRDVPLLRQPAGHAVLPRVGRQREAVLPRVRRRAGQLVALRPVASTEPLGRAHQRLVHRRRRRRLPDAQRSGRSEHRLRAVAGRQHHAARSAHRRVEGDPPARRRGIDGRRRRSGGPAAGADRPARRTPPRGSPQSQAAAAAAPAAGDRGRGSLRRNRRRRRGKRTRRARRTRRRRRPRRGRRRTGSPELGCAVHHQPAQSAAALLGEPVRLSQRRSRRQLDAHQPGSHAQPEMAGAADHGQGVAGRLGARTTSPRPRSATSSRSTSRRCSKG